MARDVRIRASDLPFQRLNGVEERETASRLAEQISLAYLQSSRFGHAVFDRVLEGLHSDNSSSGNGGGVIVRSRVYLRASPTCRDTNFGGISPMYHSNEHRIRRRSQKLSSAREYSVDSRRTSDIVMNYDTNNSRISVQLRVTDSTTAISSDSIHVLP